MSRCSVRLLLLVSLSLILLVLGLTQEAVNPWLEYRRSLIAEGQWWRAGSGHWVHLGLIHTLLNVAGLWLVALWVGNHYSTRLWLISLVLISFCVSAGLWFISPEVSYYAGMSGVLHGLLVLGLWPGVVSRTPDAVIGLIAIAAKLGYEQLVPASQQTTEALITAPVVSIAHIYGAVAGGLLALFYQLITQKRP